MYCPNCGARNKFDSKFCAFCGKPLSAEKETKPVKVVFSNDEAKPAETVEQPVAAEPKKDSSGSNLTWGKTIFGISRIIAVFCAALFIIGILAPAITVRTDIVNPAPNIIDTPTAKSLGLDGDLSLAGLGREKLGDGFWMVIPAGALAVFGIAGICTGMAITGVASAIFGFGLLGEIKHLLNVPGAIFFYKSGPAYPLLLAGAIIILIDIIIAIVGRVMIRHGK